MMENDKITIYMQCINWTCGANAFFDIMLTENAVVHVDWGDNQSVTVMKNYEQWQRVEHLYSDNARKSCEKFIISIEAEGRGQIIGLRNWSIDMDTLSIDLSECPGLQYFTAELMDELDLTHSPKLKVINIRGCTMHEIDLSANTKLERLECPYSNFTNLNLSKCNNLKEVECWSCVHITQIGISNDSKLKHFITNKETPIKGKSMRYLQETVERNGGEIIYK